MPQPHGHLGESDSISDALTGGADIWRRCQQLVSRISTPSSGVVLTPRILGRCTVRYPWLLNPSKATSSQTYYGLYSRLHCTLQHCAEAQQALQYCIHRTVSLFDILGTLGYRTPHQYCVTGTCPEFLLNFIFNSDRMVPECNVSEAFLGYCTARDTVTVPYPSAVSYHYKRYSTMVQYVPPVRVNSILLTACKKTTLSTSAAFSRKTCRFCKTLSCPEDCIMEDSS